MKQGQSFRDLGCVIGAKVRFVDDKPDVVRVITTDKQLDYPWMLPWIVIDDGTKPETRSEDEA